MARRWRRALPAHTRRGLEAAILSHLVIDVIVHVLRPIAEHGLA
jgi:hypothetical protein